MERSARWSFCVTRTEGQLSSSEVWDESRHEEGGQGVWRCPPPPITTDRLWPTQGTAARPPRVRNESCRPSLGHSGGGTDRGSTPLLLRHPSIQTVSNGQTGPWHNLTYVITWCVRPRAASQLYHGTAALKTHREGLILFKWLINCPETMKNTFFIV